MPIAVEVVPEATFNAWIASKGGTPKGVKPSTETTPEATAAAAPAPANDDAAVEQPAVNQAATAQN
jgi:cytochrome c oxidase subunit 2